MKDTISKMEAILNSYLSEELGITPKEYKKKIVPSAKKLSDLFTKDRSAIVSNYLKDKDFLLAYIAHFTITNAAKTCFCLNRLPIRPSGGILKILDIGAGSGGASIAAALYFSKRHPECKINITAVDREPLALKALQRLIMRALSCRVNCISKDVSQKKLPAILGNEKFDVIIAANFFNELGNFDEMQGVVRQLVEGYLISTGCMIVIDPALKATTQEIMLLRDNLLKDGTCHVFEPCPHAKCCPMYVANKRDWCHFYVEWDRPDLVAQLDKLVGTRHDYLKMGYLILTRQKLEVCKADFFGRVVSSPINTKGKTELNICASDGELHHITRLDKNASKQNQDFGSSMRGDMVKWNGANSVTKEDVFKIVSKFNS